MQTVTDRVYVVGDEAEYSAPLSWSGGHTATSELAASSSSIMIWAAVVMGDPFVGA